MSNLSVQGLYLLKENHDILSMAIDDKTRNNLFTDFRGFLIDTEKSIETPKIFDFPKDNLNDENINEFYRLEKDTAYFTQIKTNILNGGHKEINKKIFDNLTEEKVVSWIIHFTFIEGTGIKDFFIFQHFYFQNMYFGLNKHMSFINLSLTQSAGNIFKHEERINFFSLKRIAPVIYLDDGKIYSKNRKQFNNIFNYVEELRKKVPSMFEENYDKSGFFSFSKDDKKEIIEALDSNHVVTKKMYHVFSEKMLDIFDLDLFKEYVKKEGVMTINYDSSNKIILTKQNFEDIIEAIRGNFFTNPYTGEPYLALSKKKRVR